MSMQVRSAAVTSPHSCAALEPTQPHILFHKPNPQLHGGFKGSPPLASLGSTGSRWKFLLSPSPGAQRAPAGIWDPLPPPINNPCLQEDKAAGWGAGQGPSWQLGGGTGTPGTGGAALDVTAGTHTGTFASGHSQSRGCPLLRDLVSSQS